MGTREGAIIVAAQRHGMLPTTWRAHVEAGEKWCTGCKGWHAREAFGADTTRPDGLMTSCREARARAKRRRPCRVEGCQRKAIGDRTMCPMHARRLERGADLTAEPRGAAPENTPWDRLVRAALALGDCETDAAFDAAEKRLRAAALTYRTRNELARERRATAPQTLLEAA